jgi:hypothetical protein
VMTWPQPYIGNIRQNKIESQTQFHSNSILS